MTLASKNVLVTGAGGFLGRHVLAALRGMGVGRLSYPSRQVCDLTDSQEADKLFTSLLPDVVIHLAAFCGGIGLNRAKPAEMLARNAAMAVNVLEGCRLVQAYKPVKLVTVGSVCGYPERPKTVPFVEAEYTDGEPEPTNAPYGHAKRLLLKGCQAYRDQWGIQTAYLIPANLYGPGDCFDLERAHVIPAIIRRVVEAKERGQSTVTLWGTGTPTRDFLHVADAARAVVLAAEHYDGREPVNVGTGVQTAIADVAGAVIEMVGGPVAGVHWDQSRPDGQPRRVLNVRRAWDTFAFGYPTPLAKGLEETVRWYLAHRQEAA